MSRSGDNDDDDDDGDDNERSSQYLAHFAQYLSQRNFVDDVSEDLNTLQDAQEPPPPQGDWAADFDSGFDSAFDQSEAADGDEASAPGQAFGAEPFRSDSAPPPSAPSAFDADFDAAFDEEAAPAAASSAPPRSEEEGDLGV
jgi:hypothetical protein